MLGEQYKPSCKALMFVMASGRRTVLGGQLSRGKATNASEGVPGSFVTSSGYSSLEGIARRQTDEKVVGARIDE